MKEFRAGSLPPTSVADQTELISLLGENLEALGHG